MAIAGALIGRAIGAFGRKPSVPTLQSIDPNKVQTQTAQANLAGMPDFTKLAEAVNAARRKEGMAAMEAVTPGATDILASGTQSIAAMLKGQLPADVQKMVEQKAAEASMAGGFGGTGAGRALGARDLGLTSLSLVEKGLDSSQRWLSGALQLAQPGGFFDVSSMMFTPQEKLSFEVNERNLRYNRDLLAAQVKAAPDPATAALGREVDRFFNTVAAAGVMAAGGAMGGGGAAAGMMGGAGGAGASAGASAMMTGAGGGEY
jgi:hypothetical protein